MVGTARCAVRTPLADQNAESADAAARRPYQGLSFASFVTFCLCSSSPTQQEIHALVLDLLEPEPLVKPQRGIEALDVDRQRFSGGSRFVL